MKVFIRLAILLLFIIQGCKKEEDLTPPGEVTNLSATYSGTTIILTWTDPLDPDLDSIEVLFRKDSIKVGKGVQRIEFPGLKYERDYEFAFLTYDNAGNHSAGIRIQCRIEDLVPPAEVTSISATYSLMTIMLKWTPPTDVDFTQVEISYEDTLMVLKKRDTTAVIPIAERERDYLFTLKTIDWNGNKSNGKQVTCSTCDYRLPFTGTFLFVSEHFSWTLDPPTNIHDTTTYTGSVIPFPGTDSVIQITYRDGINDHTIYYQGDSVYGAHIEAYIKANGIMSLPQFNGFSASSSVQASYVNPDSIYIKIFLSSHIGNQGLKLMGKRIY